MFRTSKPRIIALALLALAGCALPQAPMSADEVPDKLRPAENESLAMIVPAKGVQIYECRATKAGHYEWAFVAPEAELYDAAGNRIGRHYAGPHWEANDGSKVVGQLKERADAPSAGAIPWLLLTTKSVGPDGSFGKVTAIQRVRTAGGVAPKEECKGAAGTSVRVDYTADYRFFIAK